MVISSCLLSDIGNQTNVIRLRLYLSHGKTSFFPEEKRLFNLSILFKIYNRIDNS